MILKDNSKIYDIKILTSMNSIHGNEVNNIDECNLLHGILNTSKLTNNINRYYYPIIFVCMNTHKGRGTLNNFQIL